MTDSTDRAAIQQTVSDYLVREFLADEGPAALTETTQLITGGVLSSIGTIKLVHFLEEHYAVRFEAHEMSADYLDTVSDITDQIAAKLAEQ